MGIQGLSSFIASNRLTRTDQRLHSTHLLIDGYNLENELYTEFVTSHDAARQDEKVYGGDYSHLSAYYARFFRALDACSIVPVVVMNGDYCRARLDDKKARFRERLRTTLELYQYRTPERKQVINSLLNSTVFIQVMDALAVRYYEATHDSDATMIRLARARRIPILSNDTDFYVHSLPAGCVTIRSLMQTQFRVIADESANISYLKCETFFAHHFNRLYPGLRPQLLPMCQLFLGKIDGITFDEQQSLIRRLPIPASRRPKNFRSARISRVLSWIASLDDAEHMMNELERRYRPEPNSRFRAHISALMATITDDTVPWPIESECGDSFLSFLAKNSSQIFARDPHLPSFMYDTFGGQPGLIRRILPIYRERSEFCRPLVEDFSLSASSYDCIRSLMANIYGLLLLDESMDDAHPKPVIRYVRRDQELYEDSIIPRRQTLTGDDRLPTLEGIDCLFEESRANLFYNIMGIDSELIEELETVLEDAQLFTDDADSNRQQLITALLALVHLSRQFTGDIWIEYFYAQLVNLLFMGHLNRTTSVADDFTIIPRILNLSIVDNRLTAFDGMPSVSLINGYRPRIVHLYNAYQNCLITIHLLGRLLRLGDRLHVDTLLCGLQGTFVYNLALELAGRDRPLDHLERHLLPPEALPLFRSILDLILRHCDRRFPGTNSDRQVVPGFIVCRDRLTDSNPNEEHGVRRFVRGLKRSIQVKQLFNMADLVLNLPASTDKSEETVEERENLEIPAIQ